MGDQIKITTWPRHQTIFYKVTSSALMFEVKAPGNAAIGLAKSPGTNCEFWIALGDNRHSWIKKENDNRETVNTPNIITSEEYRKFWISWNGGYIRLGRAGEANPIIKYLNKVVDLSYVTFTVIQERNPVHWRFEVPPVLEKPKIKPQNDGELQWVDADNQLPDGALIGGYEKETLYIIRAHHNGSLTPGKFVPSLGLGFISWGGQANEKSDFEVLCGFNGIWVATWQEKIPVGAVIAGYSEDFQERLYVGRAYYNGHLIPGKIQPSHKVCYIPYEGREIGRKRFETLVTPDKHMRSAHPLFIPNLNLDSASESDHDEDESHRDDWHNYDNDEMNDGMNDDENYLNVIEN